IPFHAGSITLGVEYPSGWQISATASHFGDFFTDVVNTQELILVDEDSLAPLTAADDFSLREPIVVGRVASRTVLSARFSYTLPGRDMTLWVQGRNLTNRLYISDLENGLRPGAERTFMSGVGFRF